jgi:hypothetical protein
VPSARVSSNPSTRRRCVWSWPTGGPGPPLKRPERKPLQASEGLSDLDLGSGLPGRVGRPLTNALIKNHERPEHPPRQSGRSKGKAAGIRSWRSRVLAVHLLAPQHRPPARATLLAASPSWRFKHFFVDRRENQLGFVGTPQLWAEPATSTPSSAATTRWRGNSSRCRAGSGSARRPCPSAGDHPACRSRPGSDPKARSRRGDPRSNRGRAR